MSARIGYAGGAFDLFHVGHLNLLRHAKANCDFLIAGVVTDEMLELTKGMPPVVPFAERLEIVRHISFVDDVHAESRARQARHVARGRIRPVLQGRRLARRPSAVVGSRRSSPRSAWRSCTSRTPSTRRAPRCGSRSSP